MAVSRFNPDYPDAGLTLLNATTFTGASSVSIDSVFSATYDNYKIMGTIKNDSTTSGLDVRLRVGGSDNSSANYRYQYINADSSSVSASRAVSQTSFVNALGIVNATDTNLAILEIGKPFLTQYTAAKTDMIFHSSGTLELRNYAYGITVNTSYTGFTVLPGAGTITGTIRVYGYKNEV